MPELIDQFHTRELKYHLFVNRPAVNRFCGFKQRDRDPILPFKNLPCQRGSSPALGQIACVNDEVIFMSSQ